MKKQILIFGAGPGLSRSIAHLFGKQGFSVTLVARNEEKLKQEIADLEKEGIKSAYRLGDVSSEESMNTIINELKTAGKLPDLIV